MFLHRLSHLFSFFQVSLIFLAPLKVRRKQTNKQTNKKERKKKKRERKREIRKEMEDKETNQNKKHEFLSCSLNSVVFCMKNIYTEINFPSKLKTN